MKLKNALVTIWGKTSDVIKMRLSLLIVVSISFFAISFTSCSQENDTGPGNGGGNDPKINQEPPTGFFLGTDSIADVRCMDSLN